MREKTSRSRDADANVSMNIVSICGIDKEL